MQNPKDKANAFLKIASKFKLGDLTTEKRHDKTLNLSTLSMTDLSKAIDILKSIDQNIFDTLANKHNELIKLRGDIQKTLANGNKIYLSGCGSTGRLSQVIEFLFRSLSAKKDQDKVISVMAGGDNALIKAIEDFEDHPEFSHRHLQELNFKEGDLLIASTEGGETPFVIGSVEYALKHSKVKPWFLYCNPDSELTKNVKRSKDIIENKQVIKLNLTVGPMAISGSTRMQATSIMLYAIGLSFFACSNQDILDRINDFKLFYQNLDLSFLANFIKLETDHYKSGGLINYLTNNYGMTILTDTTERSPTFNLAPFENNFNISDSPSLAYLGLVGTSTIEDAWKTLLKRDPRCLNWKEFPDTNLKLLMGFNISESIISQRDTLFQELNHSNFSILGINRSINFQFKNSTHTVDTKKMTDLETNLLLKLILNIHSTLVMGRLERYYGNLMTWVRPSCNKLIDRSIRYTQHLLKDNVKQFSYEEICYALFEEIENISISEPIVLRTYNRLIAQAS